MCSGGLIQGFHLNPQFHGFDINTPTVENGEVRGRRPRAAVRVSRPKCSSLPPPGGWQPKTRRRGGVKKEEPQRMAAGHHPFHETQGYAGANRKAEKPTEVMPVICREVSATGSSTRRRPSAWFR